jgi:hypothetical protein
MGNPEAMSPDWYRKKAILTEKIIHQVSSQLADILRPAPIPASSDWFLRK